MSATTLSWHISKLRRDVVLRELRKGHLRLALCVLFLPVGWELTKTETKTVTTYAAPFSEASR